MRRWLDNIEISDPKLARFLSKVIPAQCPFERDIKLFGHSVAHIPPLCKLNPLYDQLVGLRFRALCYLGRLLWRGDCVLGLRRAKEDFIT